MAADNTLLNTGTGGDTIRDLARQAGTIKTQVVQLDMGGASANAEILVTAGQQSTLNSLPVVLAGDHSVINVKLPTELTNQLSFTAVGQLSTAGLSNLATLDFNIFGTWVANIVFEASLDNSIFFAIKAVDIATGNVVSSTTTNGNYAVSCAGYQIVRARIASYTSGTVTLTYRTGVSANVINLLNPLPTGANIVGKVGIDQTTPGTTNLVSIGSTGTVGVNTLPTLSIGQQSSAASLPVVIANNQSNVNTQIVAIAIDALITNTLSATGQVSTANLNGVGSTKIAISNVWVGTIVFEASLDGATFFAVNAVNVASGAIVVNTTANGIFKVDSAGYQVVRARCSVFTSGSITINVRTGLAPSVLTIENTINALVTQQVITKGVQGANGVTTQDLKDAGRNQTNYFMAAQVLSTAAEVLQSLTGYKTAAAVAASTTPAVVTAAKTYRINRISITYIAVAIAGSILVSLRAQAGGVVTLTSPLVDSWLVGANAATAGVAETITIDIPDGIEFPAGTGIGVGVVGQSMLGVAAATGYAKVSVSGFEY